MNTIRHCEETELLSLLWEIRDWSLRAEEPLRNLHNIACLIGNRFYGDVCSVYKVDSPAEEIVLAATVGLRRQCVGTLRLKLGEGLCGQVAVSQETVMVEDEAMRHPLFKYFPEAGEEPYESFLGVPVGWKDDLQGVLVVQTIEPRLYTPSEIRMLSLAADIMAPALRHLPVGVIKAHKAKTARRA